MHTGLFVKAFILVLLPLCAWAEDKNVGRMPDGRAYRMDSDGNRIVDYIADLEMNVDSLHRQVVGLEDELKEKAQRLSDVESNNGCPQVLKEKDLLASSRPTILESAAKECPPPPKLECPRAPRLECPAPERVNCPVADCSSELRKASLNAQDRAQAEFRSKELSFSEEINALKSRITNLQGDLKSGKDQSSTLLSRLSEREKELASHEAALREKERKLAEKDSDAKQLRASLSGERDGLKEELKAESLKVSELNSQLGAALDETKSLKEQFRARSDEYDLLAVRFAAAEKKVASMREMLDSAATQRASLRPESLSSPSAPVSSNEAGVPSVDSLNMAKLRALESLKGRISTEINRTQGLVATRDKQVRDYKSAGVGQVDISPSAALSSDNEDLDTLRKRLNASTSMREISKIRSSIMEIQRKMEDDIALVTRLRRLPR